MASLAPYLKAITAALVVLFSTLGTGLSDGALSWSEGIATIVSFLVALGAVWAVPNKKPTVTMAPTTKAKV